MTEMPGERLKRDKDAHTERETDRVMPVSLPLSKSNAAGCL